jgi:hypothetical protein
MATDYDAPRVTKSDDTTDTSLEQLTASRKDTQSPVVDVEDTDTAASFELPGADLSGAISVRSYAPCPTASSSPSSPGKWPAGNR